MDGHLPPLRERLDGLMTGLQQTSYPPQPSYPPAATPLLPMGVDLGLPGAIVSDCHRSPSYPPAGGPQTASQTLSGLLQQAEAYSIEQRGISPRVYDHYTSCVESPRGAASEDRYQCESVDLRPLVGHHTPWTPEAQSRQLHTLEPLTTVSRDRTPRIASKTNSDDYDGRLDFRQSRGVVPPVNSLLRLGPARAATTTKAPSDAYSKWLVKLESTTEERLLHEARQRFCTTADEGASMTLLDFKQWLSFASNQCDEATLQAMRRAQLRSWLLCVARKRRGAVAVSTAHAEPPWGLEPSSSSALTLQYSSSSLEGCYGVSMPIEVRDRIDGFIGGRHVWGPINAARARAVAEAALNQLRRCERLTQAAAYAAIVSRYVHPIVVEAAEAGRMQCSTEIPTDDIALQALFEVSLETRDVGQTLATHLAVDGFEVDPKYHDPEYGLWRGFWVDKCNRLRLTLMW